MKLDTIAIKKEVEHAIMMAEELKHAAKMDVDDIEDYASRIQMVLKRVQKDVLS